ncbi:MAG: hypothetical protein ACYDDF_06250 [Thermoplasmatota archaeon]
MGRVLVTFGLAGLLVFLGPLVSPANAQPSPTATCPADASAIAIPDVNWFTWEVWINPAAFPPVGASAPVSTAYLSLSDGTLWQEMNGAGGLQRTTVVCSDGSVVHPDAQIQIPIPNPLSLLGGIPRCIGPILNNVICAT